MTAISSTRIRASWQLPPADSRNGIIKGFKLFYRKKGSTGSANTLTINSDSTLTKDVTGLAKYTEYEFQVLAFTSVGDGVRSAKKFKRTSEDGNRRHNFLLQLNYYLDLEKDKLQQLQQL